MKKLICCAFVVFFSFSLELSAQNKKQGALTSELANQSASQRLKDVSFRIEVVDDDLFGSGKTTFSVEQRIVARIFALQRGSKIVSFVTRNRFDRYIPLLLRNGVELPFLPRVDDIIQAELKEEGGRIRFGGPSIRIVPSQEAKVGILNLSDWYAPLEPGLYQLSVKFTLDDEMLCSDTIVFEVKSIDEALL